MIRKKITFVAPTFNEEDNIEELVQRVISIWNLFPNYDFDFIIIDNCSTDSTVSILKRLAIIDKRIKIIINTRNFGHIRSPYYGIIQSTSDATVYLASDLQDPPELIPSFICEWESGFKIVLATKPYAFGGGVMHLMRKIYYRILDAISEVPLTRDTTGFGLYDRVVIDQVRSINDPYPYLRGIICELGHSIKLIEFEQPRRLRGISKNNLYSLYDIGILGIISHSLLPIRMATFLGFLLGLSSIILSIFFLIAKLIWWNAFPIGIAPILIVVLGMFGVVLLFIGILGEYIGVIHGRIQNRPIVVEKERINF